MVAQCIKGDFTVDSEDAEQVKEVSYHLTRDLCYLILHLSTGNEREDEATSNQRIL